MISFIGPLAGEMGDPFQELLRQLSDHRLAERYPVSVHCGGGGTNNCASSKESQPQEGVQDSVDMIKTLQGKSVDACLSELVEKNNLMKTMNDHITSKEFQDLVGRCSIRLRDKILNSLRSVSFPLLQVCCNPNGVRSILKLLEHLSEFHQRHSAATTLSRLVISLFKDENGRQVIDFCLNNFLEMENRHIFLEVRRQILEIAKEKRGCCVLIECMEMSKGLCRDLLLSEMVKNASELAIHPSGNYLVQKLFDFDIPMLTHHTLLCLQESCHLLSLDKYGSHIMEKWVAKSSRIQFEEIVRELMMGPDATDDFHELFTDPYGNYIIQAMLSRAKDCGSVFYDILRSMIVSKQESLQCNPFGSKLLQLIKKLHNNRSFPSRFRGSGR